MNYIINSEKINRLLSDFYTSTGIAVAFYDSSMNMVTTAPTHSVYCNKIRQKKERLKNCVLSNREHMKEAARTKSTVSYTCHAGLMETIIPVLYEETLIGFMQIGQFRDKAQKYSAEEKLLSAAKVYNLEEKTCLSLYQKLPIVSDEKFEALKKILLILIKSFWDDSLIRHNRSMLSVKIEQFVSEHLKEKIYVDTLCKQFFISKNALYRLFNSEFGMTVNDYVLNKRIQFSIDLLKETSLPITRVAADCGFTDYNYFIRAFKKQVGVTPLQFRKNK
jgi:AraC-like DNA-binding protein